MWASQKYYPHTGDLTFIRAIYDLPSLLGGSLLTVSKFKISQMSEVNPDPDNIIGFLGVMK
jgi:hypothetical protein